MEYKGIFTKSFDKCCRSHRDKKKRIEKLVKKILENPRYKAHPLKKINGIDLRGMKRRHMSGNFVLVYRICDECIELGYYEKGYNICYRCDGTPEKRVIFIAFEKHQDIYSKEWLGEL